MGLAYRVAHQLLSHVRNSADAVSGRDCVWMRKGGLLLRYALPFAMSWQPKLTRIWP